MVSYLSCIISRFNREKTAKQMKRDMKPDVSQSELTLPDNVGIATVYRRIYCRKGGGGGGLHKGVFWPPTK